MYRRRSQCCPGFYESGNLCVRKSILFNCLIDWTWIRLGGDSTLQEEQRRSFSSSFKFLLLVSLLDNMKLHQGADYRGKSLIICSLAVNTLKPGGRTVGVSWATWFYWESCDASGPNQLRAALQLNWWTQKLQNQNMIISKIEAECLCQIVTLCLINLPHRGQTIFQIQVSKKKKKSQIFCVYSLPNTLNALSQREFENSVTEQHEQPNKVVFSSPALLFSNCFSTRARSLTRLTRLTVIYICC